MKGLNGKLALVTGGGGGIGQAICCRLAEEGCVLGVLDLNKDSAEATCKLIEAAGGEAIPLAADISDYAAVSAAVAELTAQGRDIDILINCAGWDKFIPFAKQAPEDWGKVLNINLVGTMNVTHVVVPGMLARGAGRIVSIASDAGRVGSAGEAAYSAAKGGIIAFTKSLAREVAHKDIRVNAVCPGPTETNMMNEVVNSSGSADKLRDALLKLIPVRRFGQPEDIAGIVAFLASDDVAYITGQVISASGGLSMHG